MRGFRLTCALAVMATSVAWFPTHVAEAQADCWGLTPCLGYYICDDEWPQGFQLVSGVNECNAWVWQSPCQVWPGSPTCRQAVDAGYADQAKLAWSQAKVETLTVAGETVFLSAVVPASVPVEELVDGWLESKQGACPARIDEATLTLGG